MPKPLFKNRICINAPGNYWLDRINTIPPAPELPQAKRPRDLQNPRFVRKSSILPSDTWEKLKTLGVQAGLTPSGILLGAYADILSFWSKSSRFTINMTIFNRLPLHSQVNDIVGDFTSLIMLEIDNSTSIAFKARAKRIQNQLWKDIDHRYFSGLRVLREMARIQKDPAGMMMPVVFTNNIVYGDMNQNNSEFIALGNIVYSISQTPQVWIDHQIIEQDGALVFYWDAVEQIFPDGLIDDMFEAYTQHLERLAQDEDAWDEVVIDFIPSTQMKKTYTWHGRGYTL